MIRTITILILCALLAGCNLIPTKTVYEEYPVPVYKVPEPPSIDRPYLPIYDLSPADNNDTEKVIRAYVISVRLLLNYAKAQEEILKTYKELSESTNKNDRVRSLSRVSMSAESNRPLSKLEMNKLISSAQIEEEKALRSFDSILENYTKNKEEIWREFDEFTTN